MKRPALTGGSSLDSPIRSHQLTASSWAEIPNLSSSPEKAWQLSMDAYVKGARKKTTVMIGVPYTHEGRIVAEERIFSEDSVLIFFVMTQPGRRLVRNHQPHG